MARRSKPNGNGGCELSFHDSVKLATEQFSNPVLGPSLLSLIITIAMLWSCCLQCRSWLASLRAFKFGLQTVQLLSSLGSADSRQISHSQTLVFSFLQEPKLLHLFFRGDHLVFFRHKDYPQNRRPEKLSSLQPL